MEHTITLTLAQLDAIQDRSYYAGFATGHEIARQNERFAAERKSNERVLAVCDSITQKPAMELAQSKID